MEVIYSAKSCEEEDSNEFNSSYPYQNNNNYIEENSSISNISEEINSYKNHNHFQTINNLSDNDFDEIPEQKKELEKIPSNTAVPFIIYENGKFIITNLSKLILNQKKITHLGIISLVGKYRTGKSFLLNRVILNNKEKSGFLVGPTFKPCTKGIWIWSEPIMIKNNNEEFPCFMIDTEGLSAYDEEANHDSKIFLISVLISSLFIFNSFGTIDENAINSLSFVLNLSKTLKLKNSFMEDNKTELSEYFPYFLWLLRDFSLKLVDKNGKNITEKEYLENALENLKGEDDNEIIKEKNKVRTLIRTYFPNRDCFVMVRPVEEEKNLQKLQFLPDDELRMEFLEQAKNFRNKIFGEIKPKIFHGHLLSGSMLLELVQSILDSINDGGIPIIENNWKYVMIKESEKKCKELIERFQIELNEYRDINKNREDFCKILKNDINLITQKYLNEYLNNNLLDEEIKIKNIEKLKEKIYNELINFNKKNEKIFEDKFVKELNILSNKFMENFSNNDIYENNSYQFFQIFEEFREKAISSTPDFPQKNTILFDKILIIIKKFINSKIMKIKVTNEEKNCLKEENLEQEKIIDGLNKELNMIKVKNEEFLNKLNNDLIAEKKKNKRVEEKLLSILDKKTSEYEYLQKEYNLRKSNYEIRLKEINDIKERMKKELRVREEQLLIMKMNNEKIASLYEQKSQFLSKEVSLWKDKYHNALIETKNKERDLSKENIKLKEENTKMIRKQKKLEKNNTSLGKNRKKNNYSYQNNYNNSQKSWNNSTNYVRIHLTGNNKFKLNLEDMTKMKDNEIIQNDSTKSNGNKMNNIDFSLKNKKSKHSADKEMKIKGINEQLINLNQYKTKINNSKDFKCKFCLKSFSFVEYKQHFNLCTKNPMNSNNDKMIYSYSNNKRKTEIDFSKSNSNINTSGKNHKNRLNNKNQYININLDTINSDFKINSYNEKGKRLAKNNFGNINIKINNQNININRNLININNIKKITNNINLNSYIKNNDIDIDNNTINNVSFNIISNKNHLNKINNKSHSSKSNSNINNKKFKHNYQISPISNFNPKKLKIKIIKGRIRKDKIGKLYLEYIIELNCSAQSWIINKKFNQFTNLYKNLVNLSNEIGIELPQSAKIFKNIGKTFSNLSHENKIVQLEKFLKDITKIDEINNSEPYQHFLEMERLFDTYKENKNTNINLNENHNKSSYNFNNGKINGKTYLKKNSNNSIVSYQYNNEGNKIDNKVKNIIKTNIIP